MSFWGAEFLLLSDRNVKLYARLKLPNPYTYICEGLWKGVWVCGGVSVFQCKRTWRVNSCSLRTSCDILLPISRTHILVFCTVHVLPAHKSSRPERVCAYVLLSGFHASGPQLPDSRATRPRDLIRMELVEWEPKTKNRKRQTKNRKTKTEKPNCVSSYLSFVV